MRAGSGAAIAAAIFTFIAIALGGVAVGYSWYKFEIPNTDYTYRVGHWYYGVTKDSGELVKTYEIYNADKLFAIFGDEWDVSRAFAVVVLVFAFLAFIIGLIFCCVRNKAGPATAAGVFMIIAMIAAVVSVGVFGSIVKDLKNLSIVFWVVGTYDGGFICCCVNIFITLVAALCWFIAGAQAKKTYPTLD